MDELIKSTIAELDGLVVFSNANRRQATDILRAAFAEARMLALAEMQAALDDAHARCHGLAEAQSQLAVQLAGCLVAAEGGPCADVKQGDYAWTLALEKTRELRAEVDASANAAYSAGCESANHRFAELREMLRTEPNSITLAPDGDLILGWVEGGMVEEIAVDAERVREALQGREEWESTHNPSES